MKNHVFLLVVFLGYFGFSQKDNFSTSETDNNYREDQFYAGITYNLLNERPSGISQSGFSSGFHFGFIRDMPLNKQRNIAIGLGLGLSSNSYNQSGLLIQKAKEEVIFNSINESSFNVSRNKFTTYLVEVPFEVRWRTSKANNYNFWRIYTGFKLGYLVYNSTNFQSELGNVRLYDIDNFNRLQYGLTLSAGYGTWNFHLYYGLNPIFGDNSTLNNINIDMKSLKIGLMFYVL
ncbi:MAG: porin family protein [Crocinitomicaceae bacterium]